MKNCVFFIVLTLKLVSKSSPEVQKNGLDRDADAEARVDRLSDQIRNILEHYKNPDPVGLPNDPVPDPMPIPDMKHSFSFTVVTLKNVTVHGLSKFRIDNAFSDLVDLQVSMGVKLDNLMVFGNHTMATWLSSSSGSFNVTLVGIYVEGIAILEVARNGHLEATDIKMDVVFQDIEMDFQNLGLMGSIFQGMVNSLGTFIFDTIKPYILSQINLRATINKNLRDIPQTFPNSIPPLDLAIAEGRKYVRSLGYDPYKIDDYHYTSNFLTVDITHTWLNGLASFYRVGNITILMEKNTLDVIIHVGTQKLEGVCHWEASSLSVLSKTGKASFSIEYFHVYARLNQTLDTRYHPNLNDLQLKLGNIQLLMEGTGTLDYILEVLVNVLPNVLRYQIMDAVEIPLRKRIQEILNAVDVSKEIEDNLSILANSKRQKNETESSTVKLFDEEGLVIHGKALNEDINHA